MSVCTYKTFFISKTIRLESFNSFFSIQIPINGGCSEKNLKADHVIFHCIWNKQIINSTYSAFWCYFGHWKYNFSMFPERHQSCKISIVQWRNHIFSKPFNSIEFTVSPFPTCLNSHAPTYIYQYKNSCFNRIYLLVMFRIDFGDNFALEI